MEPLAKILDDPGDSARLIRARWAEGKMKRLLLILLPSSIGCAHVEHVLFGTDAYSEPGTTLGTWEEKTWVATRAARGALRSH